MGAPFLRADIVDERIQVFTITGIILNRRLHYHIVFAGFEIKRLFIDDFLVSVDISDEVSQAIGIEKLLVIGLLVTQIGKLYAQALIQKRQLA